MFWDASAILPLCIEEPHTEKALKASKRDSRMIVWWGTAIECNSAVARLYREGFLDTAGGDQVQYMLALLSEAWCEIEPSDDIRAVAIRLLNTHPLRAADSLQLAAALIWADKSPRGHQFVCFDQRLIAAAKKEGFSVLPLH